MSKKQVGGEVDGYCTKCKMILGHTIVAMVGDKIARVRCNTCMGDHNYRPNAPGTKRAKAPTSRARASESPSKVETLPFETLFEGRDLSEAKRYSPKERFAAGDLLEHPTFGLGLVESVRDDKLDAVFKPGPKTLIHGLGAAPHVFEKSPRGSEAGAQTASADKPPPGQPTGLHAVRSEPPTELPNREE